MQPPFVSDEGKARQYRYFLLLENELARILRVIEPEASNLKVFGLELARLLVSSCAQFEVVAKLFCAERAAGVGTDGIDQICAALSTASPRFRDAQAFVLWRTERLSPFRDWQPGQTPAWWQAYNKVKHDPALQMPRATLENVLNAVAGLGLLTQEYVGDDCMGNLEVFWLEWPI